MRGCFGMMIGAFAAAMLLAGSDEKNQGDGLNH